jgi:hypothetical protein
MKLLIVSFVIPLALFVLEPFSNAHAQGISAAQPRRLVQVMDCDCRAKGQNWRQGEQICLNGALRICGMDQNVSSWLSTGKLCPTAQLLRTANQ